MTGLELEPRQASKVTSICFSGVVNFLRQANEEIS